MERQLLERAANGTMDEVDAEMLKARLHNTISELNSHIDAIANICDEHGDELKLMGMNIVLVVDSTCKMSPIKAMGLYGSTSFIKNKILPEITTHLEG
jgi:hypothetical protein